MTPFDSVTCPLHGSVFIEASAGTGKTYSITSLVLRLMLEKGLTTEQILMVTYTNAATDELRRKMRNRMIVALEQLSGNQTSERDVLVDQLIEKGRINVPKGVEAMRAALLSFDDLPILTIHGFCQRVLREHAFETGNLFDTELLADESAVVRDLVLDFWRGTVAEQNLSFFAYLKSKSRGLKPLEQVALNASDRTDVAILPRPQRWTVDFYEKSFRDILSEAREILRSDQSGVEAVLKDSEINRRSYNSRSTPSWLEQIDEWLDDETPLVATICEKLGRFSNETLGNSAGDGKPPTHEFFDICDRLIDAGRKLEEQLEILWTQMKREVVEFLWQKLPKKKEELNCYAYNDLLAQTFRALHESGTGLAAQISERYGAILIDEFQDTDPTQYAIFERIHATHPSSLLCLIGDPKQAIYGFRGSDIHTYSVARKDANYTATLVQNWRSDPGLIRALNTLYTLPPSPFMSEDIQYHEVIPPDHRTDTTLIEGADSEAAPLQIWQIGEEGPTAKSYVMQQACAQAVAAEAARLVHLAQSGDFNIEGRPLQPSDIAIIIRSHYQTIEIQKALRDIGLSSVSYERQHVFHTDQASDLIVLLKALVVQRDENSLKTLLLGDLIGMSTTELSELLEDDTAWASVLERFAGYRLRWKTHGFIGMFREVLARENIPRTLLRYGDGERRLTNLLHLSELVEEAQASLKLTPRGTLKWFREQKDAKQSEERELRLESDDDRIKILTIHRSKGLEFPIVFYPFGWMKPSASGSSEMITFHEFKDENWHRFIDLGTKDFEKHREAAREESMAEEMRMLYVALTRAKHRLYIMLAMPSDYKKSSLAYLLHQQPTDVGRRLESFENLVDMRNRRSDVQRFMANSGAKIMFKIWSGSKETGVASNLLERGSTFRYFTRQINRQWRIASYSSLVGQRESLDRPDHDAWASRTVDNEGELREGMFALAKGARTGNMLHQLYQKLSFQADADTLERLVEEQLKSYGFDVDEWKPVLVEHLAHLLLVDLDGFSLNDIPDSKRMNELEFHFPIGDLTARKLNRFFEDQALREEGGSSYYFRPVEGYLKGYIDLVFEHKGVFYIVDYKSNYLGGRFEDYEKNRLEIPMKESDYILQYHLYTVALHRFLKYRLKGSYQYEQHFGGVYYLFLRGVSAVLGREYGVYFDRPALGTINELDAVLRGEPIGQAL